MPKERIDHAYVLAMQKDVILCTLGDMIRVPGSKGSLQDARSKGADVHFVYSPLDILKIAKENPDKKVIYFAIGFETTTPMSAALLDEVIKEGIKNIFLHINHVTVPEVMRELLSSKGEKKAKIDAFLGPSHVSVITGSWIYEEFAKKYKKPVVVSGFEPVDVMEAILMLVRQFRENRCEVEIQYKRSVTRDGNKRALELINRYFEKRDFKWRGLGIVKNSAWRLKEEFREFDAEFIYKDILPKVEIDDHKLCICADILKGVAKPVDCKVFKSVCTPTNPLGSCMVSSEGACAAYYKYGSLV
jgi:hydrogenase expression/formation protein HypD